jgi:serine/threonine-protein kinase
MESNERAQGTTVVDGKYRLLRVLGRGGMAEVWLAMHEQLETLVAIKFVDAGLADDPEIGPLVLERFRFEARISARLASATRHVVLARDAGVHEGRPYLVMEYVQGSTLEAEVEASGGTISLARLADVLDPVARALDAAHAIGIVHRDVKPSNILICDRPGLVAKLADFGVAKAILPWSAAERPRDTIAGGIVGSPSYMSPEQIGAARAIDGRSDVWSLGVVAYEVLTGRSCFEGETAISLMMSISACRYLPASRAKPGLPAALDAWFAKTLAVDPAARFATATEASDAFRTIVERSRRRRLATWATAGLAAMVAASFFARSSAAAMDAGTTGPAPWTFDDIDRAVSVPLVKVGTVQGIAGEGTETALATPPADAGATPDVATGAAPAGTPPARRVVPRGHPAPARSSSGGLVPAHKPMTRVARVDEPSAFR